jgi:hypothetical protein
MKPSFSFKKQKKPSPLTEDFFRPYLFVLKAGNQIQKNFLDYSLILLQVGQTEVLGSPDTTSSLSNLFSHNFSR